MVEKYFGTQKAIWSMHIACCITNSTNTHPEYVTHFFPTCTNAAQYYVTSTLHVLLYLQVLCSETHHNIYTLLAFAPAVRFIFVPAVVCICAGEFN